MLRRNLFLLGISLFLAGPALAQSEPGCDDYYYGIGVPQSFQKAFECFQKADDDIWLILMTLNGEDAPQSVKKARELLTRAQKKPECCDPRMLELAADMVEEREKDPASLKTRLGIRHFICDSAGWNGTTNDIEVCWADFEGYMVAKNNAELELIESKLSAPAKAALDALNDMFGKFRPADGMWMYNEYMDGTGRGTFDHFQQILDLSNFGSLIRKVVKDHGLQRRSEQELEAKDKELNSAYRERIEKATSDWDSQLKDPASKDSWPDVRQERSQYLDSATDAERLWIKLQEPWKKLSEELYRGEMPPEEIDRAIETLLREVRIQEIQCETQCRKDFLGMPLFF
jgi:hypothetical protein